MLSPKRIKALDVLILEKEKKSKKLVMYDPVEIKGR